MTDWAITAEVKILRNDITVKSSSENPKRFVLDKFTINRENLLAAFADLEVTNLPEELMKAFPEGTELRNLIIEGGEKPTYVEFEIAKVWVLGEDFILNQFDGLIQVEETSFYFKKITS